MRTSTKFAVLACIFGITLAYSLFWKKKLDNYSSTSKEYVLEKLPAFEGKDYFTNENFTSDSFIKNNKATLVHFWGTWCAPCEVEFPDLVEFTHELKKETEVEVILFAVNDEMKKVKKFMTRFKNIPSNVKMIVREKDELMKSFGVLKVPETFLFNSRGRIVHRFSGPQNWNNGFILKQVQTWVKK